jgi:sporulation protein YlmC with PRC-barrel domain
MDLGKHVVDKELLDKEGWRAGKVDDLVLEIPEPSHEGSSLPEVVAIMTGPLALSQNLPRPVYWLARHLYHLLGLSDPRPVEIPWTKVTEIDVVVHVDIERDDVGLTAFADAVYRRFIARLPGAE